ncbi:MAG TPA: 30S ribosomal protein S9 [Anaerolineaceae bacterium]|jgi:small subunit ribosomal protein S9|nr:30S ribosomal protein S9 [Longilinea sp.]HNR47096.1 30S ribosomal protein S9 [Anaerolineaceae bacterium]HNS38296.1 30S ribosomal protein S9 [Anaerolineaceae bacterium]HOD03985.1 30S ribosomal protein S9 [Anaerolineaceae bacterium]HOG78974.1 30S ribosomal protein S9 [Anaerolineaceae bacterium]
MSVQYYEGIGRRKESTARVRLMTGTGTVTVNDHPVEEYFTRIGDVETILSPLAAAGQARESFDITVVVRGGGVTGQTDSVCLGLARALVKLNGDFVPMLRKEGLLTRDARIKERKKPGLKRARKAPTYTKR